MLMYDQYVCGYAADDVDKVWLLMVGAKRLIDLGVYCTVP